MNKIDFETFYRAYPRKRERYKALALWNKLSEAEQMAAYQFIPEYTRIKGTEYYQYCVNYLRAKLWQDEDFKALQPQIKPWAKKAQAKPVVFAPKIDTVPKVEEVKVSVSFAEDLEAMRAKAWAQIKENAENLKNQNVAREDVKRRIDTKGLKDI